MRAQITLGAPQGLTEDIIQKALYELAKLGTVQQSPLTGESPVDAYLIPEGERVPGVPDGVTCIRLEADLIPHLVPK